MKANIPMTPRCIAALVGYLIDHDDDIKVGINDFDDLRIVYNELIADVDPNGLIGWEDMTDCERRSFKENK